MDTTAQFFAPSPNGYSQNPKEVTMNSNKKYSKKALACLEQMSQGNPPSRAELFAPQTAPLKLRYEPCTFHTAPPPTYCTDQSLLCHAITSAQHSNLRKNGVARMGTFKRQRLTGKTRQRENGKRGKQ